MIIEVKDGKACGIDVKDGFYELKPIKKDRSSKQNRYLRGAVYQAIADYTGYDRDYIHQMMGMMFLCDRETYKYPYVKSTSKLTSEEFTSYIDHIVLRASEFGIYIPTADEFNY